jgi:dipeptide/tripeptide permease
LPTEPVTLTASLGPVHPLDFLLYDVQRAILVLYFTDALLINGDDAISLYSFFMALCYFAPLLGGFVSDRFLGKFKTIILFNLFYIAGIAILTGSAFGTSAPGSYIGLLFIALGTGGIKPCVSAFGADQLTDCEDTIKSRFWLAFYFSINFGSTLSYILT